MGKSGPPKDLEAVMMKKQAGKGSWHRPFSVGKEESDKNFINALGAKCMRCRTKLDKNFYCSKCKEDWSEAYK